MSTLAKATPDIQANARTYTQTRKYKQTRTYTCTCTHTCTHIDMRINTCVDIEGGTRAVKSIVAVRLICVCLMLLNFVHCILTTSFQIAAHHGLKIVSTQIDLCGNHGCDQVVVAVDMAFAISTAVFRDLVLRF